jgi:hypothetical protein
MAGKAPVTAMNEPVLLAARNELVTAWNDVVISTPAYRPELHPATTGFCPAIPG